MIATMKMSGMERSKGAVPQHPGKGGGSNVEENRYCVDRVASVRFHAVRSCSSRAIDEKQIAEHFDVQLVRR